jgi:hypothetical protein
MLRGHQTYNEDTETKHATEKDLVTKGEAGLGEQRKGDGQHQNIRRDVEASD